MKILLTGGSGFIGRNILEALGQKYDIIAPRHKYLELVDDVTTREFFLSHDIDIVIHGAVKPGHRNAVDPTRILDSNTRMFFNIVRNRDRFAKLIFLGSGAVYDMRHYEPKMREDYFDSHVPVDEHGYSKYVISKYLHQLENVTELRLFGVFGKYEDYAIRFISNAICKTLLDLPITIKQNRLFDYICIDDLMPVLEYFIQEKGRYTSYNVTPDHALGLYEIAEIVRWRSGKNLPIHVRETGMGQEYSGDNKRLRQEFPQFRIAPIEKAIDRLYSWYEANVGSIDREKLLVDK